MSNISLQKVFANNVKKYRIKKNITQEKLGEISGLHRTYITELECCKRNASISSVEKIANALELDAYLLFIEEK